MLRWRFLLGAFLIAAVAALCWLDHRAAAPGSWLMPLAVVATVLATQEVLTLAAMAGLHPLPWTVYCGNILLTISSWLWVVARHWRSGGDLPIADGSGPVVLGALAVFGAAVLLVFCGEMARYEKPGGNTANLAAGIFSLVYVGLMLNFAVQLRILWGVGALAAWVIVVKMGDIGAYATGRFFGRHKLAPRISPGKTIEGAIGALAFSCVGSWAAFRWLVPLTVPAAVQPGPWWGWIAFGLVVSAAGILGDLAESVLKRDVGRKDSSTWLPGFGGVLDILDSLLLSAPVAWACWALGLVGR